MAIPTARGVDHVGYTVPDLDQAVRFFEDVIGGQTVFHAGPFEDRDGNWMTTNLGVHQAARLRFAMVRVGADTSVELFEYHVPDQDTTPPKNSDLGARHLAIYVDDIDEAVAYLRSVDGVEVMGEPTTNLPPSPNAPARFVYFRSPWGMYFELFSAPTGMDYTQSTSHRLKPTPESWDNSASQPAR